MTTAIKKTGIDLLREPFPDNLINKLPKGTKQQNECPASEKVNCKLCGGWHHPKIVHLDYVGHAALTDRLLDADPLWTWEPLALREGLPAFDATGGLWIKLTVCGHTRLGYGHAPSSSFKEIGSREKEVIGDALRNAAMRFGAALDLWFKGDLHGDEPEEPAQKPTPEPAAQSANSITPAASIDTRDAEYHQRVKSALHAIYGDDKAAALNKVEELTTFIPKGKTEAVKGVRNYLLLKGDRLKYFAHSLEKLVPAKVETCPVCDGLIEEGKCWNFNCNNFVG